MESLTIQIDTNNLNCPISGQLLENPVITPSGNTYEKLEIEKWINMKGTSPITRSKISITDLKPNRGLKCVLDNINNQNKIITSNELSSKNEEIKFEEKYECIEKHFNELIQLSIDIDTTTDNYTNLITINSPELEVEYENIIIICIDVSGSMGNVAPIKNESNINENIGFSILDIVKHAIITLINSCNEYQYIGIVSFSNGAKIECNIVKVINNKSLLLTTIQSLYPGGCTDLLKGILTSYELLKNYNKLHIKSSIILFTDGEPTDQINTYIPTMQRKLKNNNMYICPLNIVTYGNQVNSHLADIISKETNGIYGYITDSSFIINFLEHLIANIRRTRCSNAILKIESQSIIHLENYINDFKIIDKIVTINIGNILYGLNKNIVINGIIDSCELIYYDELNNINIINIDNIYHNDNNPNINIICYDTMNIIENIIKKKIIDYHTIRQESVITLNKILKLLNINHNIDYIQIKNIYNNFILYINKILKQFEYIYININDNEIVNEYNLYINYIKLNFEDQIIQAIDEKYISTWGKHYLFSICRALELQICNNSIDVAISIFSNPKLKYIIETIDDIFITMPPPKASLQNKPNVSTPPVNMSVYNCRYSSAPCFHGKCLVKMADNSYKLVEDIKKNDYVAIGNNNIAIIECVVKTTVSNIKLIKLNNLYITEYHPVKINNKWIFPIDVDFKEEININCDAVYSFIISKSQYGIIINDIEVATLGHNIKGDIIEHPFYGTDKIINNLKQSNTYNTGLVLLKENCVLNINNNAVNIQI